MAECTIHFAERVRERIGDDVDPEALARGLKWAIENARHDLVQYRGRVRRKGERLFEFRVPDGRHFFALIDTHTMSPITVLPEGYQIALHRDGGEKKKLFKSGI